MKRFKNAIDRLKTVIAMLRANAAEIVLTTVMVGMFFGILGLIYFTLRADTVFEKETVSSIIVSPGVVQAPIYRRDGIGMLQPVLVPAVIVRCDDQRNCIVPCFVKPDGCKLENGEHVNIVRRKASDWVDQGRLQEAQFAPLPEKPI